MEEVGPAARSMEKSPATQVESFKLFLQDNRRARPDHVRQLIHIPVRQADAPGGVAVANMPRIRRSMDSIMFFREADPHCAVGIPRAGREYGCRFFRVRIQKSCGSQLNHE